MTPPRPLQLGDDVYVMWVDDQMAVYDAPISMTHVVSGVGAVILDLVADGQALDAIAAEVADILDLPLPDAERATAEASDELLAAGLLTPAADAR